MEVSLSTFITMPKYESPTEENVGSLINSVAKNILRICQPHEKNAIKLIIKIDMGALEKLAVFDIKGHTINDEELEVQIHQIMQPILVQKPITYFFALFMTYTAAKERFIEFNYHNTTGQHKSYSIRFPIEDMEDRLKKTATHCGLYDLSNVSPSDVGLLNI